MPFNLSVRGVEKDTITPWSSFQMAIFLQLETATSSLVVDAVAGSGKTKTMVEGANRLRLINPTAKVLVVAFNKAIQQTFESKLPGDVNAYTFHAFGFSVLRKTGKYRVFGGKSSGILKNICPPTFYENYRRDLVRLVSLGKSLGENPLEMNEADIQNLMDDYDVDIHQDDMPRAATYVLEALEESTTNVTLIDFDDMLWLPVIWNLEFPKYDYIMIDEAQDLATIQHTIIQRASLKDTRIFAFGDKRQAIYGFRGADSDSMKNLTKAFHCDRLPLSVTYRCPTMVVEEAQEIVPQIMARQDAPAGIVQWARQLDFSTLPSDSMVICRNNKPLFDLGMRLITQSIPCTILGNFKRNLSWFIDSFNTQDVDVLKMRLEEWLEVETKSAEERGAFGKAASIEDKYGCIMALLEGATVVKDALKSLDKLTGGGGVTLCSIHKAKGLEADTVVFYKPSLIPASYAHTPSQLYQEDNLRYVAITRAKDMLIYLEEE